MQLKHRPQEDHVDLGLVDFDNTEMLTAPVNPVAPTTGGSRPNPQRMKKEIH